MASAAYQQWCKVPSSLYLTPVSKPETRCLQTPISLNPLPTNTVSFNASTIRNRSTKCCACYALFSTARHAMRCPVLKYGAATRCPVLTYILLVLGVADTRLGRRAVHSEPLR
eukprot:1023077-Rhodomonas_salina.3